jgi:thiol-disulfide isomerase/thioredoxin
MVFMCAALFAKSTFASTLVPTEIKVQPISKAHIQTLKLTGGNKVKVIFFWASWCDFCKEFAKNVRPSVRALDSQIETIGINTDETKDKVTIETLLPYRFLSSQFWLLNSKETRAFLGKIPLVVITDKNGKIDTIYEGSEADKVAYFQKRLKFLTGSDLTE